MMFPWVTHKEVALFCGRLLILPRNEFTDATSCVCQFNASPKCTLIANISIYMTTKPNHPKNQHTVPQFLLRNFAAGRQEQVYAFDKLNGRSFISSTRNIAAEAGFYDFEHDGEQASLEPFMTRMETFVVGAIKSILHKQSLSHLSIEDRVAISLFAAVQMLRVRGNRHRIQSINGAIRRALTDRRIDPAVFAPEMSNDDAKRASINSIQDALEYAEHFYEKAWILHQAPHCSPLYTSDNPITLHNMQKDFGRGNLGLTSPGIEIYLPLSKHFSICFFCLSSYQRILDAMHLAESMRKGDGTCPVDMSEVQLIVDAVTKGTPLALLPDNVTHQNSLQVKYSSRFVYSSSDDFALVQSMLASHPELKTPPEIRAE